MRKCVTVRKCIAIAALIVLTCRSGTTINAEQVTVEDFLERSSYAVLLKELIGLSDTIGLLRCRMHKDERRFVEDSILGKTVRVQDLFDHVDLASLPEEDVQYLFYWVSLAKTEVLPELLTKRITDLENIFCTSCVQSMAAKCEGL